MPVRDVREAGDEHSLRWKGDGDNKSCGWARLRPDRTQDPFRHFDRVVRPRNQKLLQAIGRRREGHGACRQAECAAREREQVYEVERTPTGPPLSRRRQPRQEVVEDIQPGVETFKGVLMRDKVAVTLFW